MVWVKVDDQFTSHPKVLRAGPLASWLYVCGLTYCARHLTDGLIPAVAVRLLADLEDPEAAATALVAADLWESCEGGYKVHDYLDWQPSAEQVKRERGAAKERMQRLRSGEVRPNERRSSLTPSYSRPNPIPPPGDTPPPTPPTGEARDAAAPANAPESTVETKRTVAKGPGLAPIVDAFREAGMDDPVFPPAQAKAAQALLKAKFTPEQIAGCVQDVMGGRWGDPWLISNLSFTALLGNNRLGNWAEWVRRGRPPMGGKDGQALRRRPAGDPADDSELPAPGKPGLRNQYSPAMAAALGLKPGLQ